MKEGINCHIKLGSLESKSRTGKEECLNAIDMAIKAKVKYKLNIKAELVLQNPFEII